MSQNIFWIHITCMLANINRKPESQHPGFLCFTSWNAQFTCRKPDPQHPASVVLCTRNAQFSVKTWEINKHATMLLRLLALPPAVMLSMLKHIAAERQLYIAASHCSFTCNGAALLNHIAASYFVGHRCSLISTESLFDLIRFVVRSSRTYLITKQLEWISLDFLWWWMLPRQDKRRLSGLAPEVGAWCLYGRLVESSWRLLAVVRMRWIRQRDANS